MFATLFMLSIAVVNIFKYSENYPTSGFEWENFNMLFYILFNSVGIIFISAHSIFDFEAKNGIKHTLLASQINTSEFLISRIFSVSSVSFFCNLLYTLLLFLIVYLKFFILPSSYILLLSFVTVPVIGLMLTQIFILLSIYLPKITYVVFVFTGINFLILRFRDMLYGYNLILFVPIILAIVFVFYLFMIRIPKSVILRDE